MASATWDKSLIEKRNKDIIDRFHHYYNGKRIRYDHVLHTLKWQHFFINEKYIDRLLKKSGLDVPRYKIRNSKECDGLSITEARNRKLKARFMELYENNHLRLDDAVQVLRSEFYISEPTIHAALAEYHFYKVADQQTTLNFDI